MPTITTSTPARVLLGELRERTAADHAALEQLTGLPERLAEPGRYVGFLAGLLVAFEPLERALAALPADRDPGRTRWSQRSKAARIRADLAELAAPDTDGPAGAPSPDDGLRTVLAALTGRADPVTAYGARYVLEGATLGGQLLAPQVPAALGLPPGRATSYLEVYGDEAGAAWQAFRRGAHHLDARTPSTVTAAVAAASAVLRACHRTIAATFAAHGVRSAT